MASLAVAVSLLAALVHATVDFVWYVPAYAAALAVLAGLIRSLAHKNEWTKKSVEESALGAGVASSSPPSRRLGPLRPVWGGVVTPAIIAPIWIIGSRFVQAAQTEYAWNAYYRLVKEDGGDGANPATLEARVRWLTMACDCGSVDPDHYLRLGLANLELFLQKRKQAASPAGLLQTRKLLQQGRFAGDREARAWLQNRYGDDFALLQKAQAALSKSLESCPLVGEVYLHLAK